MRVDTPVLSGNVLDLNNGTCDSYIRDRYEWLNALLSQVYNFDLITIQLSSVTAKDCPSIAEENAFKS